MQKIKSSYNKTMTAFEPFVTALVVLSLLLAGAILLKWLNVENPNGLGYFLLAQGTALMVHKFSK
jgi:hypothetical protein